MFSNTLVNLTCNDPEFSGLIERLLSATRGVGVGIVVGVAVGTGVFVGVGISVAVATSSGTITICWVAVAMGASPVNFE